MKFRIFVFALLFVSGSAFAEWRFLVENSAGDVYYIDPATIRKDGNMRTFWSKSEIKSFREDGSISAREKLEIDCKKEAVRLLSLATFGKPNLRGALISSVDYPNAPFDAIAPDTIDNRFMQLVCK